jgi:membrane protease YdiL (CAAX protease family)
MTTAASTLKQVLSIHWNPGKDLGVVALSWLLVVGSLYTATVIVGSTVWGGMAYFLIYAVVGATFFGVGLPLYWMIIIRRRPIAELGFTTRWLGLSLVLQFVLAGFQYIGTLAKAQLPSLEEVLPLVALALAIGFFEAIFWRGWVLMRLEEAFGILPAIVLGSALYAAYHIGYGMPASEMVFLFFIGVMFAVVFRLTKNVFILWPVFQPMGQLITLVKDKLSLPLLASLGFAEVLILMLLLVWLATRYQKKHPEPENVN